MSAPQIGSRWLDTRAGNPPTSIRSTTIDDGTWRRIVTIKDIEGRGATVLGDWQQRIQDQWVTEWTRIAYCDVALFGRRYQPLEET